ncbi:MotA/TolQ/ExbB proton channel family protein [Paenalcaligenes sp.]|uniref:MotA/TolQ/ExbB proton channel family protein n=1 Tax=Paenalcaligenes sp. TaxID=1966342 RepID=UPI002617D300|nr:MotA/TolQ/ExbB proton channel family protein [Paenalcaligenes sp.]
MLSIIQAAGWPIWFLLLCSIIGLALIIERGISLRSAAVFSTAARDHAYELARQAHPSAEQIQRLQKTNALGHIYASLLQNKDQPETVRQHAAEDAGSEVYFQLNRYLPALGTIAVIAPLLGLFGTVVGMIEIFASYQPQGSDPTLLANGISMALYNTGFGIIIAVPALIAHRYYRSRSDYLLHRLEIEASRFNRFLSQLS